MNAARQHSSNWSRSPEILLRRILPNNVPSGTTSDVPHGTSNVGQESSYENARQSPFPSIRPRLLDHRNPLVRIARTVGLRINKPAVLDQLYPHADCVGSRMHRDPEVASHFRSRVGLGRSP